MKIEGRIQLLRPLVTLNKDEFLVVRLLQRKKDNTDLEYTVKQLKTYSFYSWEDLEGQSKRIVELCDLNNARAYIRLNKQNSVDVSHRCIEEMSRNIREGNPDKNKGVWDSVSGKEGAKDWWFLDLDQEHFSKDLDIYRPLFLELRNHFGERFNKVIQEAVDDTNEYIKKSPAIYGSITPSDITSKDFEEKYNSYKMFPITPNHTKSGIHLITKPFDTRILGKYNKELSDKGIETIKIQKDCNTVLYIGNENKIYYNKDL